jgi:hypothetical protein
MCRDGRRSPDGLGWGAENSCIPSHPCYHPRHDGLVSESFGLPPFPLNDTAAHVGTYTKKILPRMKVIRTRGRKMTQLQNYTIFEAEFHCAPWPYARIERAATPVEDLLLAFPLHQGSHHLGHIICFCRHVQQKAPQMHTDLLFSPSLGLPRTCQMASPIPSFWPFPAASGQVGKEPFLLDKICRLPFNGDCCTSAQGEGGEGTPTSSVFGALWASSCFPQFMGYC